jgi:hypothetical protein
MRNKKLLSWAFWLITVMHIIAFTTIGLLTNEWKLLLIFLSAAAILGILWWLLKNKNVDS